MKYKDMSVRFVGIAGDGILTSGRVLAGAAASIGLELMVNDNFSAEIRGLGKSTATVRFSSGPVRSMGDGIDVLVAMQDKESVAELADLVPGGCVIYQAESVEDADENHDLIPHVARGTKAYAIPLKRLAEENTGDTKARNLVAMGGLSYLFGLPLEIFEKMIERRLGRKGKAVVDMNTKALRAGHEFCAEKYAAHGALDIQPGLKPKNMISGNEAVAHGAIDCGLKFFAGYPITPASSIMEIVAKELPKVGGWMLQAEDEIAAVGAVLGGWFAGRRSMTATSGPGIALMSEFFAMSTMSEIPLVVVDVQRGGPSTGLPTKVEQGDLNICMYGSAGDAPRVVLAAATCAECYTGIKLAFDLAEKYQTPVIFMSDLFLGQRVVTTELERDVDYDRSTRVTPDAEEIKGYRRFTDTETGVSPWIVPGEEGAFYTVTGLEHSEFGMPNYEPDVHVTMTEKRFRKLEAMKAELPAPEIVGDPDAVIGLTAWGSPVGAIIEGMDLAREQGVSAKLIRSMMINPQREDVYQEFFASCRQIIVAEQNHQGQYAQLLRSRYGIRPIEMHFPAIRPVSPRAIAQKILEVHDELVGKTARIKSAGAS